MVEWGIDDVGDRTFCGEGYMRPWFAKNTLFCKS